MIALAAGRRLNPEFRDPVARRIDWTGAALSGAGLVALVWAVIEAPSKGWTAPSVLGAGAVAAVALVAFVAWQRRVAEPLLDVRLFRDARFSAASVTVMVLFSALFGFLFLSTQYLQFVLGYSPAAAGVRLLPYAGAMIMFALICQRSERTSAQPSTTRGSSAARSASRSWAASCRRCTRRSCAASFPRRPAGARRSGSP